jgi:hypothetical protein
MRNASSQKSNKVVILPAPLLVADKSSFRGLPINVLYSLIAEPVSQLDIRLSSTFTGNLIVLTVPIFLSRETRAANSKR